MKEYTEKTDTPSGQVKEPLVGYASPAVHTTERAVGISSALMDELLHQSNDVKLLIIQKLSEDELHVTGSLRNLIGAIPVLEDEDFDWKKEKEAYLMEKYGL